ncbi:hypothetical protein BRYFOR_07357 [Marvinbryantia formatexigens DSM 14469]|uniref:Uncharacterized protein n=1 Tax=Marvinbryantia formatexigens DSM 14469 TaxID=478749 RepID=C6LFF5_9FIRM|nr:hypothetical protein [Marvinbryantia formatexigens]EET60540.1 hypothetical protein BRYFOR_07357 [Marvinbryantia formatexigens DSM 14469]UWO25541.1 hypothetical protein NQ534_03360 [Marvinbryantia formatexigens DSM 14469]SDG20799.1 hypothetical protein SAMN05660368_02133 [Marvinbryantia formatexigens]
MEDEGRRSSAGKQGEETSKYFQEALADFMHDAASGDAIRHLCDLGYTTDAIMRQLTFPTPRERVEKTVYRHLTERGILLETLPENAREISTEGLQEKELWVLLQKQIARNGEEHLYVSCPFGTIRRDREARLQKMFAPLTGREREYLTGIPWKPAVMYHRLNSRMLEISVSLALYSDADIRFYLCG